MTHTHTPSPDSAAGTLPTSRTAADWRGDLAQRLSDLPPGILDAASEMLANGVPIYELFIYPKNQAGTPIGKIALNEFDIVSLARFGAGTYSLELRSSHRSSPGIRKTGQVTIPPGFQLPTPTHSPAPAPALQGMIAQPGVDPSMMAILKQLADGQAALAQMLTHRVQPVAANPMNSVLENMQALKTLMEFMPKPTPLGDTIKALTELRQASKVMGIKSGESDDSAGSGLVEFFKPLISDFVKAMAENGQASKLPSNQQTPRYAPVPAAGGANGANRPGGGYVQSGPIPRGQHTPPSGGGIGGNRIGHSINPNAAQAQTETPQEVSQVPATVAPSMSLDSLIPPAPPGTTSITIEDLRMLSMFVKIGVDGGDEPDAYAVMLRSALETGGKQAHFLAVPTFTWSNALISMNAITDEDDQQFVHEIETIARNLIQAHQPTVEVVEPEPLPTPEPTPAPLSTPAKPKAKKEKANEQKSSTHQ